MQTDEERSASLRDALHAMGTRCCGEPLALRGNPAWMACDHVRVNEIFTPPAALAGDADSGMSKSECRDSIAKCV